jgi:hypothetical protein
MKLALISRSVGEHLAALSGAASIRSAHSPEQVVAVRIPR